MIVTLLQLLNRCGIKSKYFQNLIFQEVPKKPFNKNVKATSPFVERWQSRLQIKYREHSLNSNRETFNLNEADRSE